jgi:hypothetical protein
MMGVWLFVAALAGWHTSAMRDYVALLDQVNRPAYEHAAPLERPLPGSFADAQAWVRYALALQETGRWQLRFTDMDNAPKGREMHWSSLFAQLVATAGRIQEKLTGEPQPRATEHALMWFNLPLLLGCVVLFSGWAAARLGAGAGVLVALFMVGHLSFYDGFMPNFADQHGRLTASGLGLALGVMLMGAGWWRASGDEPKLLPISLGAARRAAISSAVSGAFGTWISAAIQQQRIDA